MKLTVVAPVAPTRAKTIPVEHTIRTSLPTIRQTCTNQGLQLPLPLVVFPQAKVPCLVNEIVRTTISHSEDRVGTNRDVPISELIIIYPGIFVCIKVSP